MANRPDPRTFAEWSYYLAIASAAILLMAFLLGLTRVAALQPLVNIVWLALITSATGTFLAAAARSDFKRNPPDEVDQQRARTGLRVNLLALILMFVLMLILVLIRLLPQLLPLIAG